jgi:hypothetical protein
METISEGSTMSEDRDLTRLKKSLPLDLEGEEVDLQLEAGEGEELFGSEGNVEVMEL